MGINSVNIQQNTVRMKTTLTWETGRETALIFNIQPVRCLSRCYNVTHRCFLQLHTDVELDWSEKNKDRRRKTGMVNKSQIFLQCGDHRCGSSQKSDKCASMCERDFVTCSHTRSGTLCPWLLSVPQVVSPWKSWCVEEHELWSHLHTALWSAETQTESTLNLDSVPHACGLWLTLFLSWFWTRSPLVLTCIKPDFSLFLSVLCLTLFWCPSHAVLGLSRS